MPELPEVETIKRSLDKYIKGQTILGIEIRVSKLFHGHKSDVIGSSILEIERRAKMLIWKLSNNKYLLFHFKMTGQLLYVEKELGTRDLELGKQVLGARDSELDGKLVPSAQSLVPPPVIAGGGHPDKVYLQKPPHQFTHIIFTLDRGHLYFNDLRKFGWIKAVDETGLKAEVAKYGPETDWPEFTFDYFVKALNSKPKTKIKTALMFKDLIAGIGNIYSDEILFKAKVLPTRLINDLSEAELKQIYSNIKPVLDLAIKHGGTSLKDYRKLDGSMGDYLRYANVYHCNGEPCKVCDTKIERIVVNGRSAHFCPNCQK